MKKLVMDLSDDKPGTELADPLQLPRELVEELMRNMGGQDVHTVRLCVGRNLDPSKTFRMTTDGDGGILAFGPDEEAATKLVETIHRAGLERRPIPFEFVPVPWRGQAVAKLVTPLPPIALPAPSPPPRRAFRSPRPHFELGRDGHAHPGPYDDPPSENGGQGEK